MSDAAARMRALGGEERVVLDVGSRICRAGFSGEPAPRVMLDAAALCSDALGEPLDALWELNLMLAHDTRTTQWRYARLVRCLNHLLRRVFQEHLQTDATQRKVLLVCGPLQMDAVQHALCDTLLQRLGAPCVSLIDSHVLSLVATGRMSGLVVDCGYLETCVMPVYGGRPMRHLVRTTPRAGQHLSKGVHALLRDALGHDVPPAHVEAVKTQALLVGEPPERGAAACVAPLDVDAFAARYSGAKDASSLRLRTADGAVLEVPGWVRERAAEVLFEPGDEDEASIIECVEQCAVRLPMDLRREVLASVVLAGGTAMLPGFARRFQASLAAELAPHPHLARSVRVLNAPQHEDAPMPMPGLPSNLLPWIGASIAGSLKADGVVEVDRAEWAAG